MDDNERCESIAFCKNVSMHVWGHVRFEWNINRNVPSTDGIKSQKGCGFQTHEVDSTDDNKRCESAGFCKCENVGCSIFLSLCVQNEYHLM